MQGKRFDIGTEFKLYSCDDFSCKRVFPELPIRSDRDSHSEHAWLDIRRLGKNGEQRRRPGRRIVYSGTGNFRRTLPGLTSDIPWAEAVLIMTASITGSVTLPAAVHSTMKLAPAPPAVSVS